jgi:type 2 lantibiotic biosynthesis protein LanM
MRQSLIQHPAWYRALTVQERLAARRADQRATSNAAVDTARAERQLRRWRSQSPFRDDSAFAQRLALDGLREEEFFQILGEPAETIRDYCAAPPAWLAALAEAFARPDNSDLLSHSAGGSKTTGKIGRKQWRRAATAGFLDAIAPLIQPGHDRVRQGIQALISAVADLPFDPATVEAMLFAELPDQLLPLVSRAMILELNVARLQGLLHGDSAEERFQSFVARICEPDHALAFLQAYPVLARLLVLRIERWAATSLEFLQRLCDDWPAIRARFSPEREPGVLVEIDGWLGDQHRGGRSVLRTRFSSGFQLVYKPRSLAIDVHFQDILAWLNDCGANPPFRTLAVLDRGTHGWVEFVAAQGCGSEDEIRRFYERQGGYLALLYALRATDFHSENLIAAGEHPLFIDLESFFYPAMTLREAPRSALSGADPSPHTILSVGLLPERQWSNTSYAGIDISGLGGVAGQALPPGLLHVEALGSDAMHVARKGAVLPGDQNRPTLQGREVDVLEYTGAIVTGFIATYQLIRRHRADLLADDGLLARCAADEVRVILRPSQLYGRLLSESFHPDLLRDALDRDRYVDRIWVGVEHDPALIKVLGAERAAIQACDIPLFTTRPDSRDVWGNADERIVDFFDAPGLELVQQRLGELSDDDLARQISLIHSSLTPDALYGAAAGAN